LKDRSRGSLDEKGKHCGLGKIFLKNVPVHGRSGGASLSMNLEIKLPAFGVLDDGHQI
jgi:hypothetical protein